MKTPLINQLILPALAGWLAAPFLLASDPKPDARPVEPKDALKFLHVADGFEAELMVTEPDVIDPVAFTWGPDGRLWVAEMTDYPLGMDGKGKPGGKIRWLRDSNGDGQYDQSVIFADGLSFPNGVLPWKKGVLVTSAPLILYLADTDGDGVSDKREVLFKGFKEGNQQLRVNGLTRGLDNWIYCASGSHTSKYGADSRVISLKTGREIALGSRDFRFDPDTGALDPQSGPSQFGRNRTDWGDWFGEMNSYPLWHYVLRDQYIRRNPYTAPPDPRKQLVMPKNPKVYAYKAPQKRFMGFEQTGRFTSACSGMVYRDRAMFPGRPDGDIDIFTCEPFSNLIQHNHSEPDGPSFTVSQNGPVELAEGVDFFASKDRWCRPVMVRTGPDGALWVADMYRYMIEHPQWLPKAGQDELRPFYRLGEHRGRIYRIYRKGQKLRAVPNLEKLSIDELVAALESPNGWQRDNGQALLIERNAIESVDPLKEMAKNGRRPLARLHALCTLEGMGALELELLKKAASDPSSGVRRHAVRLSTSWVTDHPDLLDELLKLADDKDAKVRMQLAYSLGDWKGKKVEAALGRLAFSDGSDPYMAAAILSSVNAGNLSGVLASLLAEREKAGRGGDLIGSLLALAVAYDNREAVTASLDAALKSGGDRAWQYVTVAGLLDALDARAAADKKDSSLSKNVRKRVVAITEAARKTAMDPKAPAELRKAAIRLMAREAAKSSADVAALGDLLGLKTPAEIQVAVVSHLGTRSGSEVPPVLLKGWSTYTPLVRAAVLNVLTTRTDWLTKLLDSIASKKVARADIDAGTLQRLVMFPSKKIRERSGKLLASLADPDRLKVEEAYRSALKLKGDKIRVKLVFQKVCAACHKLDGVGLEIGPNLASVTDRRPETLLVAILDPNQAVEAKYSSYLASTKDGRAILGILISETGASITILDQANQRHVISRSDLASLTNTGRSLMPEGLDAGFNQQELADLMAFVGAAK